MLAAQIICYLGDIRGQGAGGVSDNDAMKKCRGACDDLTRYKIQHETTKDRNIVEVRVDPPEGYAPGVVRFDLSTVEGKDRYEAYRKTIRPEQLRAVQCDSQIRHANTWYGVDRSGNVRFYTSQHGERPSGGEVTWYGQGDAGQKEAHLVSKGGLSSAAIAANKAAKEREDRIAKERERAKHVPVSHAMLKQLERKYLSGGLTSSELILYRRCMAELHPGLSSAAKRALGIA